jgi:putative ABC transport system permease protein
VGVLLGVVGVKILERTPVIHGLLEADVSPGLLVISVLIAVLVGLISGFYPAWRSSRLNPGTALQG